MRPETRSDSNARSTTHRGQGRGIALLCLLALTSLSSGCEIGRTWGAMSSDSPTPFFGFDLLPRRTTQLAPPQRNLLNGARNPWSAASNPLQRSVSDHKVPERSFRDLTLPSVRELLTGEEEHDVTLTGPESAFSR